MVGIMNERAQDAIVEALRAKADESSGDLARELRQVAAYVASPRLCSDCGHGQRGPSGELLEALARRCENCGLRL